MNNLLLYQSCKSTNCLIKMIFYSMKIKYKMFMVKQPCEKSVNRELPGFIFTTEVEVTFYSGL